MSPSRQLPGVKQTVVLTVSSSAFDPEPTSAHWQSSLCVQPTQ
jgi:hypothetical protein